MSIDAIRKLLLTAHEQYGRAVSDGHPSAAAYWNGYIRGLAHVLNTTSLADS